MASRFVARHASPPGGLQHSWHADDDGGDSHELSDLPPSPPQPPRQHQQFPFQPPSPTLPPQHEPQQGHEQEESNEDSYLPSHLRPPSTPPPRSRWADSSSPPAHSNRSSAFDPDAMMSSDDGAEPLEDEQQQQSQQLQPPQQHQQDPLQADLASPVLPPFPPFAKEAADDTREEHKELAEERYSASSFQDRPRVDYASSPQHLAPSARAPAVSRLLAGEERAESGELSDGWDEEETEGEYSNAPLASQQQRTRRKAPASALEASSEAAAALFSNPHVQSALSAAQSGLAYTRSTLESGMDLAGQRSSEFMERVMPVIVATAQSAAAVSAETLSVSVMPSVSAAVQSTYEQVSMSVVPGVVQQAKAVQRWLAQRVHLSTPVHPAQLMSAGSSSTGAADTKEDLGSYIAYIEAALKKSEEQDEQQASRVLDQQHGSPGGLSAAAAAGASGSSDPNASSYLSGQSVLVFEDHFDKITEKEKTKLTLFLAEMKRVRNSQQQQQIHSERSRGNSVDLHAAPSSFQHQQPPPPPHHPHQHRRDDSTEDERKQAHQPQPQHHSPHRSHAPSAAAAPGPRPQPKSSSRRPSSSQHPPQPQPHPRFPAPAESAPHPFPDLLSAPFPPTDLSSDASAEPLDNSFASRAALPFEIAARGARAQQQLQPPPQPHDRHDSFPDLLSAPFAPASDLPSQDAAADSSFHPSWLDPAAPPPRLSAVLSAHLHPASIFSAISHPQQPPNMTPAHTQHTHTHPHAAPQHRQHMHRQPPPPPSHHMHSEAEDEQTLDDDE